VNDYKLIYILDDDDLSNMLNRQFLNFSLPKSTVVSFQDPSDLLKNLIKNRLQTPDLLLLDIAMPEMNAWEFLDLCLMYKLDFDVMMLTCSLHLEDIKKANSYKQVKNYIPKPLNSENILKCIKNKERVEFKLD
jgi:response regulator RpfG family c-di-GMP phosphodiesterase